MRIRNWYFQGWERRTGENGKSVFVYTGEYYEVQEGARPRVLALAALLVVLYLPAALLPSPGGLWRVAAIPQLLEIIPLIYLVIGGVCLLRSRGDMTFRDWYASWRRMEKSAMWSILFSCLMVCVEAVYLVLFTGEYILQRELLFLLNVLCCSAVSAVLFEYIRRHPCKQSAFKSKKE